jgi:3-hydroxybutyryl-CoA dehydrogenase
LAKIYEVLAPQMRSNHEVPEVLRAMVGRGDYGLKTGKGFFDFTDQEISEITAEKDRRFMVWSKLFQESNQGNSDT